MISVVNKLCRGWLRKLHEYGEVAEWLKALPC